MKPGRVSWRVDLAVFLALFVLFILAYVLGEAVTPFFIAMLFAYILNPAVEALARRKVRRGFAVALFAALFFAAVTVIFIVITLVLKFEIPQLLANIPGYMVTIKTEYLPQVQQSLGVTINLDEILSDAKTKLAHFSSESLTSVAGYVVTVITGTVNVLLALVGFFLVPILMMYILFDYDKMVDKALRIMPKAYKDEVVVRLREVETVLRNFAKGQLLVAFFMGALYTIGLTITGVDMPVVVGMTAGLANLIPYLGTTLGAVVSVVLVLLKYHDLMHPGLVLLVFALVQGIEAYYITPKVVGDKLGLHPVIIILSLLVFGKLLGFVGILLAVPIAAVLKVFLSSFIRSYMESDLYSEHVLSETAKSYRKE